MNVLIDMCVYVFSSHHSSKDSQATYKEFVYFTLTTILWTLWLSGKLNWDFLLLTGLNCMGFHWHCRGCSLLISNSVHLLFLLPLRASKGLYQKMSLCCPSEIKVYLSCSLCLWESQTSKSSLISNSCGNKRGEWMSKEVSEPKDLFHFWCSLLFFIP